MKLARKCLAGRPTSVVVGSWLANARLQRRLVRGGGTGGGDVENEAGGGVSGVCNDAIDCDRTSLSTSQNNDT